MAREPSSSDARSRGADDGPGMPSVKRAVTTGTLAPPPYTVHSLRMRWFIVALVSLAGLFSCALLLSQVVELD